MVEFETISYQVENKRKYWKEMKMRNKILLLVMLMGIVSVLFGCMKNKKIVDEIISNTAILDKNTTEITSIEFPEGTKLTGFYMHQMGMEKMPYYILRTTKSGTYMKITDLSPDDYNMWKEEDTEPQEQPSEYFSYIETVKDIEYASLVKLEDDVLLRQIEECIVKYGALGWDGFNKSESMPGVMDSGTSYNLYLELSDGTTVTMHGYNICPAGFDELYSEISDIFQNNSDYSRYMATNFFDSPCTYLEVEFREREYADFYYKIELRANSNQWSLILKDPVGMILEKEIDISDYKEMEEKLLFKDFLNIMSKHHVQDWNQYQETDSTSVGMFYITMYFEDGKEFLAHGNVYPDGFEEFRNEFVKEMYDFYMEFGR